MDNARVYVCIFESMQQWPEIMSILGDFELSAVPKDWRDRGRTNFASICFNSSRRTADPLLPNVLHDNDYGSQAKPGGFFMTIEPK